MQTNALYAAAVSRQLCPLLMDIRPVALDGKHVRLEPLSLDHHADLSAVGLDEELWRWTTTVVRAHDEMRGYIRTALEAQAAGTALPFAVIAKPGSRAIGSTRYMNIGRCQPAGGGWLHLVRARLPADRGEYGVEVSLTAEEGTLRNHMVTWSGRLRHSVYYRILDSEWPDVKRAWEARLTR